MIPKSVRWRLPLSYGAIALLAALALGLVLLTTLRGYYRQQELDYLTNNAQAMGSTVARLVELDLPASVLEAQLSSLAFLSQTRVRLLDPAAQELVDSGAPQDQQGEFTLALEAEMLDIRDAAEMPDTPPDVGGLFVRRDGNSLFVGTGNLSGYLVSSGEWEFRHDGPVVEVLTTRDTMIYRDDTLGQLGGVAPAGPIQQVLKPGSLDELGKNSTVKAWGERHGERVIAGVIVFATAANQGTAPPEGQAIQAITQTLPPVATEQTIDSDEYRTIRVLVEPTSGREVILSSGNPPGPGVFTVTTSAVGTPYGFGLNAETPSDGIRSDQMTRQAFFDQGGALLGYVELSEGPAYGRQILDSVTRGWALAGSVAVALAAVAGWMASRRITTPLLKLTAVTTQMAEGDLSARADVARQDELGQLGRSFNKMAAQVEQTVLTLRRFLADAAHALQTPLTALQTNLELVAEEERELQREDLVTRAQAQVERLASLTKSLLDLSRLESAAAEEAQKPIELTALVQETSELWASRAEQAGLDFSLELPGEPLTVRGQRAHLQQALGNLLDNAIKFTPKGGEVQVGLGQQGERVVLWVQDSGIGVPADDLPQLFSRFHRGSNAAAYPGSGLGLAIVKAIVERHDGQVAVESVERGTRFSIRLTVH